MLFRNRQDAGRRLAAELSAYANRPDVCALALPRGGVPVAYEVARAFSVPLDIWVVRKIGAPQQPELAIGAIATGGVELLSPSLPGRLRILPSMVDEILAVERLELARREQAYRGNRPPIPVEGKTVLLIDDGVATGASMQVGVAALRQRRPARVVIAVPVIDRRVKAMLAQHADEVISVLTPTDLNAVGEWYEDFSQTTDEEVCRLLSETAP
jgi:putative phosphoribosyl transferase